MVTSATELEQRISAYTSLNAAADKEFEAALALARELDPEDQIGRAHV